MKPESKVYYVLLLAGVVGVGASLTTAYKIHQHRIQRGVGCRQMPQLRRGFDVKFKCMDGKEPKSDYGTQ